MRAILELFWRYAERAVGSPPITKLKLPMKVLEARLALEAGESSDPYSPPASGEST